MKEKQNGFQESIDNISRGIDKAFPSQKLHIRARAVVLGARGGAQPSC